MASETADQIAAEFSNTIHSLILRLRQAAHQEGYAAGSREARARVQSLLNEFDTVGQSHPPNPPAKPIETVEPIEETSNVPLAGRLVEAHPEYAEVREATKQALLELASSNPEGVDARTVHDHLAKTGAQLYQVRRALRDLTLAEEARNSTRGRYQALENPSLADLNMTAEVRWTQPEQAAE
jgi:hypothetical protein